MKVSKVVLAGLTGFVLVIAVKKIMSRKIISDAIHDIFFDAEFIPGNGRINQFIPDNPEMRNWFKSRQLSVNADTEDAMFI